MIRKIGLISILVLTMLAISLSACSSQSKPTNKPAESTSVSSNIDSAKEVKNVAMSSQANIIGAQGAKNERNLTIEKMLIYAIQDEYLARGEYEYILKTFGDEKPFNKIIKAEEKHIDLLKPLITKYNANIPEDNAKEYVPHPKSMEEALKTGFQAEVDNIEMYESFLKEKISEDVKAVFIELRDASRNHLESFKRNLESNKK